MLLLRPCFIQTSGSNHLQMPQLCPATDARRPMTSPIRRFWFCVRNPNCEKPIQENRHVRSSWTHGLVCALCVWTDWGRGVCMASTGLRSIHTSWEMKLQVNVWQIKAKFLFITFIVMTNNRLRCVYACVYVFVWKAGAGGDMLDSGWSNCAFCISGNCSFTSLFSTLRLLRGKVVLTREHYGAASVSMREDRKVCSAD